MVAWETYDVNGERVVGLFRRFSQVRALVIGDVTSSCVVYAVRSEREPERFGYGLVLETNSRRSWVHRRPGSAGLVATTIRSTGAAVRLIAVVGQDATAKQLHQQLRRARVSPLLLTDQTRPSTERTRVYLISRTDLPAMPSNPEFRFDNISFDPLDAGLEEALIERTMAELAGSNLIVLADYGPNIPSRGLVEAVFTRNHASPCTLVVHPRVPTLQVYMTQPRNPTIVRATLCLDWAEACIISSRSVERPSHAEVLNALPALSECLLSSYQAFDSFAIRLGQFGAAGLQRRTSAPRLAELYHFDVDPTIEQRPYRAVGCGAVFTGILSAALAAATPFPEAVALGNFAAGLQYERRAEQGVVLEDILQAVRVGGRRVQPPSLRVSVGDREAESISRIVQRFAASRRIFLEDATRGFTVSSGYLPLIAYDARQRKELEHLVDVIRASSAARKNLLACIFGPSRSGKTEVARSIHSVLGRQGEVTVVNCAAESPQAVLDALKSAGNGDTVILDELGQASASAARDSLLHVLNELKDERNDLLVLATTSVAPRDLGHDVFNRMHGPFRIYPLHEARENIPFFLAARLREINDVSGRRVDAITALALSAFLNYDYAVGLRDLSILAEEASLHAVDGVIRAASLPDKLKDVAMGQEEGELIEFVF